MRVGGCDARKIDGLSIFSRVQPSPTPAPSVDCRPLRCARNINKDGALFGVRVRSWRSYEKIEDCKQSTCSSVPDKE